MVNYILSKSPNGLFLIFERSVQFDFTIRHQEKLQKIRDLSDFAPLHNPAEAREIEAFMNVLPDVPQVAVSDTSFHETLDPVHYLYSIPYEYYEK